MGELGFVALAVMDKVGLEVFGLFRFCVAFSIRN